ncbi:hypothetical protein L1049_012392 [Liquidambar formosana]|uniref:Uncharacterized protein n=1 Tax=Liquidambar formosana TaxID=63359 RepID=A0AAP0N323_LIQFO
MAMGLGQAKSIPLGPKLSTTSIRFANKNIKLTCSLGFANSAKLKSDKSSGKEVEEGPEGENASAHQGIQHVISEIQEEA